MSLNSVATGSTILITGNYRCQGCESGNMGVEVFLTKGDICPSCLKHRAVRWVMASSA